MHPILVAKTWSIAKFRVLEKSFLELQLNKTTKVCVCVFKVLRVLSMLSMLKAVMNRYGILNSVSVSVFSGPNTEVSVSVLKSVCNRYEIGFRIGIKLASIWNLVQFIKCSCEYNIAIEPKISRKSVSTDLEPKPNLKSVFKKLIKLQIGSVSVCRID